MTLRVDIPDRMDGHGLYQFLRQVFDNNGAFRSSDLFMNFKSLKFIEPVGVTSIANTIQFAKNSSVDVRLAGLHHPSPSGDIVTEAARYLDDAGLFSACVGKYLDKASGLRSTMMPMQMVTHGSSHMWLESKFLSWLSGRLGVIPQEIATIKVCFQELFNNIKDHSGVDVGCIYAQHYPKNRVVKIALSDFGSGIPARVRKHVDALDDAAALLQAAEEGFTTRSNKGNRGVGLDLLIRKVVHTDGGRVEIRSGRGRLSCYLDRGSEVRKVSGVPGYYPGTLIEVQLLVDTLVRDEVDREDLEW